MRWYSLIMGGMLRTLKNRGAAAWAAITPCLRAVVLMRNEHSPAHAWLRTHGTHARHARTQLREAWWTLVHECSLCLSPPLSSPTPALIYTTYCCLQMYLYNHHCSDIDAEQHSQQAVGMQHPSRSTQHAEPYNIKKFPRSTTQHHAAPRSISVVASPSPSTN